MSNYIFSGLVKCGLCQSNMRGKKEKGVRKYICGNYHNYKKCVRIPVIEDDLIFLIKNRYEKEMSNEEIREMVEYIEVFEKVKVKGEKDVYKLTIHLKHDEPIILGDRLFQF